MKAAELAGFSDVQLYPEPAAAIIDEELDDGVAVSVDFGGGTFDVAVIEVERGSAEVLALHGAGIGGSRFDAAMFDEFIAPELRTAPCQRQGWTPTTQLVSARPEDDCRGQAVDGRTGTGVGGQ